MQMHGKAGTSAEVRGACYLIKKNDLQASIELLLQDREADVSRGLPADAVRMPLQIG